MASHKAPTTFTGRLTKAAQSFPDKPALSSGKFEISHSCLQELIDQLALVLRSAGVSPGDVVVLPFPNSIEMVHISVPTLNGDSTHGLVHNFSNDPSDGALLLHNSGTTSRPKVIALSQHDLAALVNSIPSVYRMTDSDLTMVVLPLFYVHGLPAGLLSPLSAGGSVPLASLGQFSASTFWGDMHKPGSVDKLSGVPQLTGVAGEVCISVPNVTKGYKNNPEANETAFLSGGFHNGHYLGYLNGRVKELINNGGSLRGFAEVVGLGNQTSLPESREQNTFNIEVTADPDPLSVPNGSNGIWHLWYITGCNFVSNATVGVLYLGNKIQGCNETYQRAELIASVGVPIAVAAGTFVASFLFASNPGRWSNWISGMSMINAGMTVGGPLSFNWVRN